MRGPMSLSHTALSFPRMVFVALSCGAFIAAQAQMQGDLDSADSNHHGRVTFEEFGAYATYQLGSAGGRKARSFSN